MPKLSILFLTVLFLVSRLFVLGASPAAPAAKVTTVAKAQTPRMSDSDLEKAIQARLAASKIHTDKFTVKVRGGIATLEGYTEVVQHKGVATRLAKTAGALAVVNNIQISQAAKDKAQANLDSGRRRAQIKRSESTVARSQKQ